MECRSKFLSLLEERGYVKHYTNFVDMDNFLLSDDKKVMYIGFDCTAPSLHIGSLIQIMILRIWQKCGFTPIALLGGATTKIGDPSGKDKTRNMLEDEEIARHKIGISNILRRFLKCDGDNAVIVADNSEWWDDVKYIDFLRNVGRYFSVNRMLTLDSVSSRIQRQQEMNFIEFNYVLLQAYDFCELYKRYGCMVEAGGSDQWGNIINGVDLVRKMYDVQGYGFTSPLLVTASGKKMGKTEGGAIWLDGDLTSPYDYWQYFRNVDDKDVRRMFYLFTELEMEEIHNISLHEDINQLKRMLATEVTTICHGADAAREAESTADRFFMKTAEISLDHTDHNIVKVNDTEITIREVLCESNMVATYGEAKRIIRGGGVYLDGSKVSDINLVLQKDMFPVRISIGKKRHKVIAWQ